MKILDFYLYLSLPESNIAVSRETEGEKEVAAREGEEKKQEYITAVLPGQGESLILRYHIPMLSFSHTTFPCCVPDGTSQYISLPADPRVLSGEYSYAVLQQPDGSSQIVLMENSTMS